MPGPPRQRPAVLLRQLREQSPDELREHHPRLRPVEQEPQRTDQHEQFGIPPGHLLSRHTQHHAPPTTLRRPRHKISGCSTWTQCTSATSPSRSSTRSRLRRSSAGALWTGTPGSCSPRPRRPAVVPLAVNLSAATCQAPEMPHIYRLLAVGKPRESQGKSKGG